MDAPETALAWVNRTGIAVDDPLGDVRGRRIITADEEQFGFVDDLLIDKQKRSIRYLEIDAEAPGGLSRCKALIPVQMVQSVDQDHIYLRCALESLLTEPTYNPHVVPSEHYLREVHEHFDFPPPHEPGEQAPWISNTGDVTR